MVKQDFGVFISFEGTEGSGKSTLIRELSSLLQGKGLSILCTREPGGSPFGEKLRKLLLDPGSMHPWTELFLFEAGRVEHCEKVIQPALKQGQIVLCDRFIHSTLAYQAQARGLPWDQVKGLNEIATLGLKPDLVVFLDIDPEVGLRRSQDLNRFEIEGLRFQEKVREGFIKARSENPSQWLTLDIQSQTPGELAKAVFDEMVQRWPK